MHAARQLSKTISGIVLYRFASQPIVREPQNSYRARSSMRIKNIATDEITDMRNSGGLNSTEDHAVALKLS